MIIKKFKQINSIQEYNSFIRLFSLTKFYKLGFGWLQSNKIKTNLNEYIYCTSNNTHLLFMDKILLFFKKSFLIFENIIKKKGTFFFIGLHFCYFKQSKSIFFYLREKCLIKHFNGLFSNFLYKYIFIKNVPDLILFFNSDKNISFLKEIKKIGIPSIGTTEYLNTSLLLEYYLCCNFKSYFINFFFLNSYSKLIYLNKK